MKLRSLALGAAVAVVLVPTLPAQRQVQLGRATARASEPLSLVTRVRELKSGEILVADPIERKLIVFDGTLKSFKLLGREGSGPGEYRQPDAVFPYTADSSLVVDLGNARLSIVGPNGAYGRSIPMASGGAGGPPSVMMAQGTDAQGGIYFTAGPGAIGRLDSTDVLRADGKGGAVRRIGRVKTPDIDRQVSGGGNAQEVRMRPIPLSTLDGWAVTSTGEVAIVRSGDYHVEWVGSTGTRAGAPVAMTRARIGAAEKKEWVSQQMLAGGIAISIEDRDGQRSMSFGRSRPTEEPSTDEFKWPSTKPPFDAASLRLDGSGRLWARRLVSAGQPIVYDVFGNDGNLIATVTFPARRVLVAFGATALYAVEVDDDGVYHLERYAVPL
ncbi:MAG: hypothetical protein ACT4P7_12980 [Gemmatimonadaceae bacterium]